MEKKPTLDSIKKCKQESATFSLQEVNDALGLQGIYCSTFLSSIGLLAQGEWDNQKWKSRNAVVTFRDPATAELKGKNKPFFAMFVAYSVDACLWFNTQGRAITANKRDVNSVICILYKKKQYLGVSGSGDRFEVFNVSKLKENEFLGRDYVYLYLPTFLCESLNFTL